MSLAAVPAWLLARRVAGRFLSLLAAALAVALPSLAYTATLVTENLFYPLALVFAWTLVRVLERPSWGRIGVLAVALAAAFATRSQALGFVAAVVLAPACLALLGRERRLLRPFAPLYGAIAGLGALVVGVQLVAGRIALGPARRLQRRRRGRLRPRRRPALLALARRGADALRRGRPGGRARRAPRPRPAAARSAFRSTSPRRVALVVTSTAVVGAFASRFASDRVQDRYLFFCAPLLLVAVLGWIEIGAPRPRVPLAAGSALALALVRRLSVHAVHRRAREVGHVRPDPALDGERAPPRRLLPGHRARRRARARRAGRVRARRVGSIAVPLVLLGLFVVLSRPVWSGPNGVLRSGEGALFQGIRGVERDWLDTRAERRDRRPLDRVAPTASRST